MQQGVQQLCHRSVRVLLNLPCRHFADASQCSTSPYQQSRKWGVYFTVGLVLKCYFKVNGFFVYRSHRY